MAQPARLFSPEVFSRMDCELKVKDPTPDIIEEILLDSLKKSESVPENLSHFALEDKEVTIITPIPKPKFMHESAVVHK